MRLKEKNETGSQSIQSRFAPMTCSYRISPNLHCGKMSSHQTSKGLTNECEVGKTCNKGSLNVIHPYVLTSTKIAVGLEGTAMGAD